MLLPSREDAVSYPTADLVLEVCETCGLVTNSAFDSAEHDYSASYLEVQAFSPRFRSYLAELSATLVERHCLRGRAVVEIGCGRGDFLLALCARTRAAGYGVDPSFAEDRLSGPAADLVRVERAFFESRHVPKGVGAILCRHTLEHIHEVSDFLGQVRSGLERAPDAVVVFEVPDAERVFVEAAFWDVFYEHCSYFTPGSLARAFRLAGLRPTRLERVFDEQYLLLTAERSRRGHGEPLPLEEPVEETLVRVRRFSSAIEETRKRWSERLRELNERGERIVIWGAGSKGVGFLTMLALSEEVACAVDVNPAKHGMFMPGTGHEIVPPERLRALRPSLVVVMNPAYQQEIEQELRRLDVHARVASL